MSTKRKILTFAEKKQIIEEFKKSNQSKAAFAKAQGIPRTSLNDILASELTVELCDNKKRKRQRASSYEEVEKALLIWIKYARAQNVPISSIIVKEKALQIAAEFGEKEFSASNGWIDRFKTRHNLTFKKICGEANDVDPEITEEWKTTILKTVCEQYKPNDIFNVDECGLFYRLLPDKTLTFKNEKCIGGKKSKERLTILLGSNMDGSEKLKPIVIGKSKNPRCFKRVKFLPVTYEANSKAWMTSEIWEKSIKQLDRQFSRKGRKIALVIDNCSAHSKVANLEAIELVFLPPNATSVLQPMDQGIIRNFKLNYRKLVMKDYITAIDDKAEFFITILDAIFFLVKSWNMVSPRTIINCFRHAGFKINPPEENDTDDDVPLSELAEQLRKRGCEFNSDEYISVDSEIAITPEITVPNIVLEVKNSNSSEHSDESEEERDEPVTPVSYKDAISALKTIKTFFISCEKIDDKDFAMLSHIEKIMETNKPKTKQASIKDFFK